MSVEAPRTARSRSAVQAGAVDVTVLICTRNRAQQLKNVLETATCMRIPEGLRWELVVVDNGSSDNTSEVAAGFGGHLPIRVVREDAPGLSHARNRGVAEAAGTYICWTDDDVLIDPNWLCAYVEAFARHPEAAVFGGEIIPVLQGPTPKWFARLADQWPLTTLLAKRNYGEQPIRLGFKEGVIPWGANFAVRAAEQRQVRYEAALGVSPLHRRVGEETEVVFRILQSGGVGWWAPGARVRHIIPTQRQTLRHFYEYFQSYGETAAYMERAWPAAHHMAWSTRDMRRVRGSALSLYTRAAAHGAMFIAARLLGATRRSLQFLMIAGIHIGAARIAGSRVPPGISEPAEGHGL